MAMKIVHQDKPLLFRLSKLIVHAQFVWWLGHVSVVVSTVFYFLSLLSGNESSAGYYSRIFRGSILSYGIVVWKGHKPFNPTYAYFMKIFKDETTSYLFLAIYWLLASPIIVSSFPFFVFSIFHCLNYLRTRFFPAVLPVSAEELKAFNAAAKTAATPPSSETLSFEAKLFRNLQTLTLEQYAPAMKLVSLFEVTIIPVTLLLGLLTFNVSVVTCFVYGQFLFRRAGQSGQTKAAFVDVDTFIQKQLENPSVPASLKSGYIGFRDLASKMSEN